jgi:ribose transport system substrate-binding protein
MDRSHQCGCAGTSRTTRSVLLLAGMAAIVSLRLVACSSARRPVIGVIPQTDGTMIWEAAHVGAATAARQAGVAIYWNAPTREDDVEAQIALVEQVVDRGFRGLVLAPDQALSLISPVRRALAHGIPTVIIGSPLPIPAGGGLFYIVNDDAAAGRMAAQRLAALLHGRGTVAVLGIDPDFMGIMTRERSFEEYLDQHDPDIHIVSRQMGSFNGPRQQQIAEATLSSHPSLGAIVALISPSLDATLAALASMPNRQGVRVIGFDVSVWPAFEGNPSLDCVIQENTRLMGQKAVEDIELARRGGPVPLELSVPPVMITRANMGSAQVRWMFSQDWTFGRRKWSYSR